MTPDNRSQVRRVLVITLLLNLLVMVIKIAVGWWTGSLSLLADALHSVTDSANNILGLIANPDRLPQTRSRTSLRTPKVRCHRRFRNSRFFSHSLF